MEPEHRSLMEALRRFLESPAGKAAGAGVILVAAVALFVAIRSTAGPSAAAAVSADRTFICSETLKSFKHELKRGESVPVHSPYSGKDTGYPAELCYWTKDGKVKQDPDAVLLKSYLGETGPTFCPKCGRLVVGHNPRPHDESSPPPTREEYAARHGAPAVTPATATPADGADRGERDER
jgi:hypothetical protein